MVYIWAKDYVKYDEYYVLPIHIFFSSRGGTGISHLVKVIYNAISKTLFCDFKGLEKPRVLLLRPTIIWPVNISGVAIHSDFEIKQGAKLLSLNNKSKASLKNRLSVVKFLITYELSTASSDFWRDMR